jgi:hypothetical protein
MNYKQIVLDQKEELSRLNIRSLTPREAEQYWTIPTRLIRIITGVRRSGKLPLF